LYFIHKNKVVVSAYLGVFLTNANNLSVVEFLVPTQSVSDEVWCGVW
jgi:hypothetical protein